MSFISMIIKFGSFVFRYRNVLGPAVFVVAMALSHPRYPLGRPELKTLFNIAGIGLALLGEGLRIVTVAYEYIVRGGRNRRVYASKLVTGGLFAHCRNPLYLANIFIGTGLSLIVHAYAFYLIVIPAVVLSYRAIVATEEAYLLSEFGAEYEAYLRRVNRWWPRLSGFSASVAGMRFEWKRVFVKEYTTMFALPATLFGVYVWSEYMLREVSGLPPRGVIFGVVVLWAALYLTVRALKKGGHVTG